MAHAPRSVYDSEVLSRVDPYDLLPDVRGLQPRQLEAIGNVSRGSHERSTFAGDVSEEWSTVKDNVIIEGNRVRMLVPGQCLVLSVWHARRSDASGSNMTPEEEGSVDSRSKQTLRVVRFRYAFSSSPSNGHPEQFDTRIRALHADVLEMVSRHG